MSEKPKAWIYRGEVREPTTGEHFIDICHHPKAVTWRQGVVRAVPNEAACLPAPYPIVEPLPDDVVMVPREMIEALEGRVRAIPLGRPFADYEAEVNEALAAARDIYRCADPPKQADKIAVALANAKYAIQISGLTATVKFECLAEIDHAIAARERELEERK